MPYSEIPTWLVKRAPIDWGSNCAPASRCALLGRVEIPPLSSERFPSSRWRRPFCSADRVAWQDLMRGV
jgi:hypothetical protein